jgi:hypothetical protein
MNPRVSKHGLFILMITAVFVSISFSAKDTVKILWCGNSYSDNMSGYWYKLVNCDTCGTNSPVTVIQTREFWPASNLHYHYSTGPARSMLDTGKFDFILLQDMQGNLNWSGDANNKDGRWGITHYTDSFCQYTRPLGTEVMTFYNWASKGASQAFVNGFYDSLCDKYNTIPMPIGVAWGLAQAERPDVPGTFEYFDPNWNDGNHPGRHGSYLESCVAFAVITNTSPVGCKYRVDPFINDWEPRSYISADDALFLQQKAWQAYQLYFSTTTIRREIGKSLRIATGITPVNQSAIFDLRGRIVNGLGMTGMNDMPHGIFIQKADNIRAMVNR